MISKHGTPWITISIAPPPLNVTIAAKKEVMPGHDPIIELFMRKSEATTVSEVWKEADKFADDLEHEEFVEWMLIP